MQERIGRFQTVDQTVELYDTARRLGYESINLDLIYGLPGQTEATMAATLDTVVELRPDRLAVYSFAYVPWMRPHQKRIAEEALPDRNRKFQLLSLLAERLTGAGYRAIGMDHYALPEDELAVAAAEGTLTRNFMGYTTRRGAGVVALGSSGISDLAGAYAQNHRRLADYYGAIDRGTLPVERGLVLTDDDLLRRHVITELMCNATITDADVRSRFGIGLATAFAPEIAHLTAPGGLVDQGMVIVAPEAVTATELGRVFIRTIARVFDARTREPADRPMFSRTI